MAFPDNKKLIIAGGCEDREYLSFLEELIKNKTNIIIKGYFLSDKDAENLIKGCNGLILSHSNEEMIVSGSFILLQWVLKFMRLKHLFFYHGLKRMLVRMLSKISKTYMI
ncbi:hypothetical protein [Klebsiella pneumoniae]|uniref:hypothetical protein n=1 Tax=Klebsiella pneumoniae TaxID=573 RepID=UPI0022CDE462|nr:hypothetical protein [Klebsiella pneumoniae]MCZ9613180.1 hypothetical protein [Klebsiella pneumoniae]